MPLSTGCYRIMGLFLETDATEREDTMLAFSREAGDVHRSLTKTSWPGHMCARLDRAMGGQQNQAYRSYSLDTGLRPFLHSRNLSKDGRRRFKKIKSNKSRVNENILSTSIDQKQ